MKNLLFLLLATFSVSYSFAQSAKVGVKGGLNYSTISGDLTNEDIYDGKIGFNAGLTANFPVLSDNFLSVQPELLFSQKGYQYRDQEFTFLGTKYERKGKLNFNYLDLPVLLKINAGGLYFEGGPQLSYLLGINNDVEEKTGNATTYSKSTTIDKDDLAELEVGYAAGLGFQGDNGLSFGLRYNSGFKEFANSSNNDELTNARHSVFQLQVGFLLGGTK